MSTKSLKGDKMNLHFLSWRGLGDYAPKKVMGLGENALEMFDGEVPITFVLTAWSPGPHQKFSVHDQLSMIKNSMIP